MINKLILILFFIISLLKAEEINNVRMSIVPEYEQNLTTVLLIIERINIDEGNDFSFTLPNDVDSVFIIDKTNDGKLVFNISYTVATSDQTIELAVGGTGASLAFTVALLSISVGDSVSDAAVSPTLVELAAGATSQNIIVAPINTHFINPYNITVGTSSLNSLNTGVTILFFKPFLFIDLKYSSEARFIINSFSSFKSSFNKSVILSPQNLYKLLPLLLLSFVPISNLYGNILSKGLKRP